MAYPRAAARSVRRTFSSLCVCFAFAFALWGCSHGEGPRTNGGAGATGSGGASDDAGMSGLSAGCPKAIPAPGDACTGIRSCIYQDCAGRGIVDALCNSMISEVHTTACTATACSDGVTSCPAGAICVREVENNVDTTRCVSNPCGTGPVGCDHACYADLCSPGLMCYSTTAGYRQEVDCQAP